MAHAATIEDSSLNWEDSTGRDQLLNQAPAWSSATIRSVYEEYLHPERHGLPPFINGTRPNYDALFIHSFWGPLNNPFTKYARPAKVFIFISDGSKPIGNFMAPVVKDSSNNSYYVFEEKKLQPTPLKDWVYNKSNGFHYATRINVCTGYGVSPKDTCAGKNFESEIYSYPQVHGESSLPPSPQRRPFQDWHDLANTTPSEIISDRTSALDNGVPWDDIGKRNELLKSVVTWPSYKKIKKSFKKIRDNRYFNDEYVTNFGRRISWLYPDDGCYSRIAAVIKDFFGPISNMANIYPRPSKVFAFGNLCVNTKNTTSGSASWWYHVAPIVRDAKTNKTYVLDPSVNPAAPTPIEVWMQLLSAKTGGCAKYPGSVSTFNICNGYGLAPNEPCAYTRDVSFETEIRSMMLQRYFHRMERDRQVELGRDPNKVLGDSPPWLS